MPHFDHFVITKFNVDRAEQVDVVGRTVRTIEWLDQRFELFERYCLPSVRAQTNLDFTWLVRFDDQVPERYVRRIRAHEEAFPNLVLVPARRGFHNVIPERMNPGVEWLLTTRLDNDDGLHRRAIEVIQESCRDLRELVFLNMTSGYAYAHPEGYAARSEFHSNNNISLLERRTDDPPHTAVCVSHHEAASFAPVRQIGREPLWLRVIHDRSLSGKMSRGKRVTVDLSAFGVVPD